MDSEQFSNQMFIDYFELQLSEVEMLNSMYPNSSEFSISLPSIVADMNGYIAGKTRILPNELDITLNLDISDFKEKLEVNITFPHDYPACKPCVSARSAALNRTQQKELNFAMTKYINSLPEGDLCTISLINWLTENAGNYFSVKSLGSDSTKLNDSDSDVTFCRMWIYSHHIYNKFKRREIVSSAQDFNLTGFSLPGKPGFICVEGIQSDCNEFLHHLKQMSWKKMSLVKEETEDLKLSNSSFRKFEGFQEISFQVRRGPAKEYHMDMGQFLKYLEEHNSAYVFHDLFGIEGHTADEK